MTRRTKYHQHQPSQKHSYFFQAHLTSTSMNVPTVRTNKNTGPKKLR